MALRCLFFKVTYNIPNTLVDEERANKIMQQCDVRRQKVGFCNVRF